MPEGPEIHFASRFINSICKDEVFSGNLKKSTTSRSPLVPWNVEKYTISAASRGKEMKLTLKDISNIKDKSQGDGDEKSTKDGPGNSIDIVFKFGLRGRFTFDPVEEIHKHAHLTFFTEDKKMALSFVDQMRFGSWAVSENWGQDRGPCVLSEYDSFRENVLNNLKRPAFNKPICESLLEQRYFNGVGNYLRAEILYRAGIPPFVKARDVLESLAGGVSADASTETPDILQLCHTVPNEVINLTAHSGYNADADTEDSSAFSQWLRCYNKPDMKNMVDHNNRTIWFSGPAGPLARKDVKEKHAGKPRKGPSKAAFKSSVRKPTEDTPTSSQKDQDVKEKKSRKKPPNPEHSEKCKDPSSISSNEKESVKSGAKRTNGDNWETSPRKLRSARK